jgi:hypothetical protein
MDANLPGRPRHVPDDRIDLGEKTSSGQSTRRSASSVLNADALEQFEALALGSKRHTDDWASASPAVLRADAEEIGLEPGG